MTMVSVHEAKTRLSRLIAAAEAGEEVVIARKGVPVARLVAIAPMSTAREPGLWRQLPGWTDWVYDPDLFNPLETDEQLAAEGWPV